MALRQAQLTAARWKRCKEVFGEVLRLPQEARKQRLDAACAEDETLCRAVEDLLAGHARSGSFLEPPLLTRSIQARLLFRTDALGRASGDWVDRVLAGRYRVRERIGSGAVGDVHRAEDLLTGEAVACKVLRSTSWSPGLRFEVAALRAARPLRAERHLELGAMGAALSRGRRRLRRGRVPPGALRDLQAGGDAMNDHERFSRQADEAVAVLQRLARRLHAEGRIGIAHADAIAQEAAKLRVAAYQAGRSEPSEARRAEA